MTLQTVSSSLTFPKIVYSERQEVVRDHDFFLCSSADGEWLTGVPRIAAWSEFDPALSEAVTAGFVGAEEVVFSINHSQWHLEAGEAMRAWAVDEYRPGTDPLQHFRELGARAGWREDRPIHVPPSMPYNQVELLSQAFPAREIRSTLDVLGPFRARKEDREIAVMRDVAQRTLAGMRMACARLRPGVGRVDFLAAVHAEILAQGVDDVAYGPDCWATGPHVSIDWTNMSNKHVNDPLQAPCSVSLDVGASLRGYRSDVGRTIFVGEPPPRSAEALRAIAEARQLGAPMLAPGRRAHAVDDETRALIARRGFGDGQWIPSGHGIGLELHEPPTLGEADMTPLVDGNVVTFELAIWERGAAGAFGEDTVVVREADLEWLLDDAHEPLVIA
jgi:Xaa-Pro aminopeptidase